MDDLLKRMEEAAKEIEALHKENTQLKREIDAVVSGLGLSLPLLQEQQRPWVEKNFGDRPSYWPLLGAVEELGELSHAHLKQEQGIRVSEDFDAMAQDAVGDCVVFLCDYCSARGWDIETCIAMAWEIAKKRDWKNDPVHGEGV